MVEKATLEFRERELIERQLSEAGFSVTHVWGDWTRTPTTADSPLLIFEARSEMSASRR